MATITAIKDKIGRLDQASFQILCDDYLSRVGYPNLVALGTMSGAQKTTPGTPDTYFCKKDDKYVFAEYTRVTSLSSVSFKRLSRRCLFLATVASFFAVVIFFLDILLPP